MFALRNIKSVPRFHNKVRISVTLLKKCSSKPSGSNGDQPEDAVKKHASTRLKELLKRMIEEDVEKTTNKLELAKPKMRRNSKTESEDKEVPKQATEKDIIKAVKNVAEDIGGNVKQTESELLNKLLNLASGEQKTAPTNLSDVMRGMKIDRETKTHSNASRAKQVKSLLQNVNERKPLQKIVDPSARPRKPQKRQERIQSHIEIKKIDLFGPDSLEIFDANDSLHPVDNVNFTWKALRERELRLAITHPPSNYFQEMILWTEQGKLWKFPIDNEQDLKEEENVYFADHIFLDKYLEPWCPSKGPIRHYMELVCVGLSKNPYLSVKHKKEHIEWYRNYFNEKQQLLKDIGAVPQDHKIKKEISDQ